jgi:lysine decarboxylase
MEAADGNHVVGIATPSNTGSDFKRLARALLKIGTSDHKPEKTAFSYVPEKTMEIHEAVKRKSVPVEPDDAVGRICGTMVVPYPPGIPLACPGEKIEPDMVRHIKRISASGCGVIGLRDNRILVLERK